MSIFDFLAEGPILTLMKSFNQMAIIGLLAFTPVGAFACDMHGPGGMHWTPAGQWQNFSPMASVVDPGVFGLEEEDPIKVLPRMRDDRPAAEMPKARPSFSAAAVSASQAAKKRVMASARIDEPTETSALKDMSDPVGQRDLSDANAQSIR
jgi:hypothetical protein